MSVIIRDVPMPQNCMECPCCQFVLTGYIINYKCGAMKKDVDINAPGRHEDCPLFEVKDWREA